MSSVDDIATGCYTLCLGLFGDPEAMGPARQRAEAALKHFTKVFPESPEYAQGLLESLRQSEPSRPGMQFLSSGQAWKAQLEIARKSHQDFQVARVGRFLKDIVSEDPRLVAFGGLLFFTFPEAGFWCLARNHQGQLVEKGWGALDADLLRVLGRNPMEWNERWTADDSPGKIEELFGLVARKPVVSSALEDVSSRLRYRLVGEGLPLAMPAKRGPRF